MKRFYSNKAIYTAAIIIAIASISAANANCVLAESAVVNGISIEPTVVDEKAKTNDIFEYTVTLKNLTDRMVTLYAVVADDGKAAADPSNLDRTASLASWVSVSRGVQNILPGQDATLPLKINISGQAKPGVYYAKTFFVNANDRWQAEAAAMQSVQPTIWMRIEVKENIVERAELASFAVLKNIYIDLPVKFSVELKNIGNTPIFPAGGIRIYDRKGEEVEMLALSGDELAPDASKRYDPDWDAAGKIGRFKARLLVEYGSGGGRDIQDIVYFWILPRRWLYAFGGGIILSFALMFAGSRRRRKREARKIKKSDGVLNLRG